MLKNYFLTSLLFLFSPIVFSQSVLDLAKTSSYNGLFNFYYEGATDKIFLEVEHLDSAFIYVNSLSQGVGNNDLLGSEFRTLDRGAIRDGGSRLVKFIKAGNKLLLIQPNLKFRAITENRLEKKSVEEAFAKSVLFGFPIVEKTKSGYLVDLTPFLMQDSHGVGVVLKETKQGDYRVDLSRSAMNMERTKSFPENVDFDVLLTLHGRPIGRELKSVTPDAEFVTVYQHHSFVLLPDENFESREHHPNCGLIPSSFMDYSSDINETMEVSLINKHRLEKIEPGAEFSEAIEPIIYYLDNGTPEPIRSALMDGAAWWNAAFEEIGFKDAFQIKILPDTIDPLDARYNVIQWVHRSSRGWSYGTSISDPRTGEIIKGLVSLGSLRVRQDFLIAQALSKDPFKNGKDDSDKMLAFALARIRQLAAHEVGHTLGFAHNFAASTNNRASVMDYPYPLVTFSDGEIDYSDAYAVGIGAWDKVSVAYAYSQFEANEKEALLAIIENGSKKGLRYVSDSDSRPQGSANLHGHLWDNGENAVDGLMNVIEVRKAAINQFGVDNIKDSDSFEKLEDLFVLIYFYHRYQTEAAVKTIGGLEYKYGWKDEILTPAKSVAPEFQRKALKVILQTTELDFLAIPKDKLAMFPSRTNRGRESFETLTGSAFDAINAAVASFDQTIGLLLNPQRVNRLISQKGLETDQLSFNEVLDVLFDQQLLSVVEDEYLRGIQLALQDVLLGRIMNLAQSPNVLPQVRSISNGKLAEYLDYLQDLKKPSLDQSQHIRKIEFYFKNPKELPAVTLPKMPDGSPIGTAACTHG
jgi:hypothetical protein